MTAATTGDEPSDRFSNSWSAVHDSLASLREILVRELNGARESLGAILDLQAAAIEQLPQAAPETDLAALRRDVARAALLAPLDALERQRPLQRAYGALEAYHRGVTAMIRRTPVLDRTSGTQLLGTLGDDAGSALQRRLVSWRRDATVALAAPVAQAYAQVERLQRAHEARLLAAFARGTQQLRRVWEDQLARLNEEETSHSSPVFMRDRLDREIASAIGEIDGMVERLPQDAAQRVVAASAWRRTRQRVLLRDARSRVEAHWVTQMGALRDELQLDRSIESVESAILSQVRTACDKLEMERGALLERIDAFLAWLDAQLRAGAGVSLDVPPPAPDVAPSLSRLTELDDAFRQTIATVPTEVRLLRRFEPMPRRRGLVRTVTPRAVLNTILNQVARPRLEVVLENAQQQHVGLVGEIERARQVIEFAAERQDDPQSVREALQNARSLLSYDHSRRDRTLGPERAEMTAAIFAALTAFREVLGQSRVGAWTQLGRIGLRRALAIGTRESGAALWTSARTAGRAARGGYQGFLVAIQWSARPALGAPQIQRRAYLPNEFAVDVRGQELPALYRRLFRLDAVTDARFLVGREDEMAALAEARAFWEAGRPVAVCVVGERGSGKTSLINCAAQRPLAGLSIVRGEVSERISGDQALQNYFAELLQTTPQSLQETLHAERRVIVIEESERFFLRRVGGFAAVHELQRLIAASSASTLWIIVMNRNAYRLLNAATQLGDGFSHRMDVASARPETVRQAILVRHNLSGLRIRYLRAPRPVGRWRSWRDSLRPRKTAEEEFFDALARESAGVFRTALQLWLAQIESLEGGTLVMKPVGRPPIDEVIEQLDQSDLFSLAAVMQHGSLTPEEHAAVFNSTLGASRAQLDDLLTRELIESDPERSGLRVRPSAIRVVREALHRRNLA
jgi:hypothetical protein